MYLAFTDGACRCGNPGETSCAYTLAITNGEPGDTQLYFKEHAYRYLGPELHTNNYAEYQGMLDLLRYAEHEGIHDMEIYCDSKLVVEQVKGVWKVNEPYLKPFQAEAHALLVRGGHKLIHIRGHQGNEGNEFVDRLCNIALDEEFARRANADDELKVEHSAAKALFESTGKKFEKLRPTQQRKVIETWKEDKA